MLYTQPLSAADAQWVTAVDLTKQHYSIAAAEGIGGKPVIGRTPALRTRAVAWAPTLLSVAATTTAAATASSSSSSTTTSTAAPFPAASVPTGKALLVTAGDSMVTFWAVHAMGRTIQCDHLAEFHTRFDDTICQHSAAAWCPASACAAINTSAAAPASDGASLWHMLALGDATGRVILWCVNTMPTAAGGFQVPHMVPLQLVMAGDDRRVGRLVFHHNQTAATLHLAAAKGSTLKVWNVNCDALTKRWLQVADNDLGGSDIASSDDDDIEPAAVTAAEAAAAAASEAVTSGAVSAGVAPPGDAGAYVVVASATAPEVGSTWMGVKGHSGAVTDLAWLRQGDKLTLLSSCMQGTILLWEQPAAAAAAAGSLPQPSSVRRRHQLTCSAMAVAASPGALVMLGAHTGSTTFTMSVAGKVYSATALW